MKNAFGRLSATLLIGAALAGSAFPAVRADYRKTDSRFGSVLTTVQDGRGCPQDYPVLEWDIEIDRVVTLPSELNADGTLKNPDKLIQHGVVNSKAKFKIPVEDSAFACHNGICPTWQWNPVRDTVLINGHLIGPTRSIRGKIDLEIDFDVRFLKFPVRGQKMRNVVRMKTDRSVFPQLPFGGILCGLEQRYMAYGDPVIEIKAMAPVILVHGNNQSPAFWDSCYNLTATDVRPFFQKFVELGIPFDSSVNLRTQSIVDNASDLAKKIDDITKSFGSDYFHIFAHSKGGLDSRQFLQNIAKDDKRGILSVTTLSTPHLGSVLADLTVLGHKYGPLLVTAPLFPLPSVLTRIHSAIGFLNYNDGHPFLTTQSVEGSNRTNNDVTLPRTTAFRSLASPGVEWKVVYRTIRADANIDGSHLFGYPTLNSDSEIACLDLDAPFPLRFTAIIAPAANYAYNVLFGLRQVTVLDSIAGGFRVELKPNGQCSLPAAAPACLTVNVRELSGVTRRSDVRA